MSLLGLMTCAFPLSEPTILTMVTVQPINDVYIPDRASNELRGDIIRLGDVYVCDNAHYEILETTF